MCRITSSVSNITSSSTRHRPTPTSSERMHALSLFIATVALAGVLVNSTPVQPLSPSHDHGSRLEPLRISPHYHRTHRVFGNRHRHIIIRDIASLKARQGDQIPIVDLVPPEDTSPTTIFWAFGDSEPSPSDFAMMSATVASPMPSAIRVAPSAVSATPPAGTAAADPSPSSSASPVVGQSLPGPNSVQADRRAVILHILGFLGLAGVGVVLVVIGCQIMVRSGRFGWGAARARPEGSSPVVDGKTAQDENAKRKPTWSSRLSANIGFPFQNYRLNAGRYDEKGIEKTPHYLPSHLNRSNKTVSFEDEKVLNMAGVGLGLPASNGASDLPALTYRITAPAPIYQPGRTRVPNFPAHPPITSRHLSLSGNKSTYSYASSTCPSDTSEDENRPLVELIRATPANKVISTDDNFRPSSFTPIANVEPLRPKSARSISFAPGTVGQRKSGKSVQSTASSEWDIARAYRYDQSRSGVSTVSGISGMSRISEGSGTEFESRIMAMRASGRSSC